MQGYYDFDIDNTFEYVFGYCAPAPGRHPPPKTIKITPSVRMTSAALLAQLVKGKLAQLCARMCFEKLPHA